MKPKEFILNLLTAGPEFMPNPTEVLVEALTASAYRDFRVNGKTFNVFWNDNGELDIEGNIPTVSEKIEELHNTFIANIAKHNDDIDYKNSELYKYTNALKVLLNLDVIVESPITEDELDFTDCFIKTLDIEDDSLIMNLPPNITSEWAVVMDVFYKNVIKPMYDSMDDESQCNADSIDTTIINRAIRLSQYNGEPLL